MYLENSVNRPRLKALGMGAIAPLILIVGTAPALAHGAPRGVFVQGMVIAAGARSLQVQTQTGAATFALSSKTHVLRLATGTRADLTAGTRVNLMLSKGTSTVTAINIDAQKPTTAHPKTMTRTVHRSTTTTKVAGVTRPAHTGTKAGAWGLHAGGQVVSVSANSIVLSGPRGNTTYTLSNSITIIKTLNGAVSDLAVGQSVRVAADASNNAFLVTIVGA